MTELSVSQVQPRSGDGRGGFFAVDRRAWALVCGLGMNPAVAYLVLARGTGGDNRTSKWSTNAIEGRTGISRSRAAQAIAELERAKAVVRDLASKHDRPKYKIAPAHEIAGCEGLPPPSLNPQQQRVFDQLVGGWTAVPKKVDFKSRQEYSRWDGWYPREVADELVQLGRAVRSRDGTQYRAIGYDAEGAAKPDWIWLPNALVDGAGDETPPVELVRQTGSAPTLRLLVDLYGAHHLDEDGGVHLRRLRQDYKRHKVGERGPYVVWGFVPDTETARSDAPFVAPHVAHAADDRDKLAAAWEELRACWKRLRSLGLVEVVAHLVHADSDEGEIIHPMALEGTGLEVERAVCRAAVRAGLAMTTPGQRDWAMKQRVVALAPVERHIEGVEMLGIARLRYRPRTRRTIAFGAREARWWEVIARLDEMARDAEADGAATPRGIKVGQG